MAQPSLAMIPAGYKATKLYSQLPVDGVGDFTVARNSVATRVNSDGLIEEVGVNIPRLDYLNGSCPELLPEPQSTNLIVNSNSFNSSDVTLTTNYSISPDGTQNTTLAEKTTTGDDFINSIATGTLTGSSDYTISLFIKRSQGDIDFRIEQNNSTEWDLSWNARFSLTSSGVSINQENNCTAKVISYPNDWYRVEVSLVTGASPVGASPDYLIRLESGFAVGSGFEFWESQLENLPFATSIIKTSGATVTRLADEITSAGDSSTFNSSDGVLNSIFKALANDLTFRTISISDGTSNNRIGIGYNSVSNTIEAFYDLAGVSQCSLSYAVSDITEELNVSFRYSLNNFSLWINNVKVAEDLSGSVGGTWDRLNLDRGAGGGSFYGRIKQILYFDSALSDSELQNLTS